MIVPASSDEKVYSGVVSLVGVVTAVTCAITGAVVSVVVVVLSEVVVVSSSVVEVVEEPPPLLLPQEMTVRLKRNIEKMMSRCFTWFPISGLGERNTTIIW